MNTELLEKLCCCYSVSGKEHRVTDVITSHMEKLCDEIIVDNIGNIICIKKGKTDKTVTLDAHIDSVGFVVNKIHENGFVSFSTVGGIDNRILPSQEVVIHGKKDMCGIITSKPPHLRSDKEDTLELENMFIDTGIVQNVDKWISVGDLISFKSNFNVLNKYVSGTSLDDRAGVASIIEVFKQLSNDTLDFNLIAQFSVREEIGLRGAYFSKTDSNLVIVIDATHGKTPDESSDEVFNCSKGVAFGYGPNIDKYYYDLIVEVANKNNIPYQIEVLEGSSGTNAWAYQNIRNGIPSLLLSFPLKYMHTPIECMSITDYDNLILHLISFIKELSVEQIKSNELTYLGDIIG